MVDKAMDQGLEVNRERLALRLDWRGDHSKFIANHPYETLALFTRICT
jgi:hypothetical protein